MAVTPQYEDRVAAGARLAHHVAAAVPEAERGRAVVVGLARGGVPVAAEVAERLGLPLRALIVRKLGHPRHPEFALGAVTAGGGIYVRETAGLPLDEVRDLADRAVADADALAARLHPEEPRLTGATAVLVDDGLATGATMIAAARWARVHGATRVVTAAPVASRDAIALLAPEADAVVCPFVPRDFMAVGLWYREFPQLDDAEVTRALRAQATRPA